MGPRVIHDNLQVGEQLGCGRCQRFDGLCKTGHEVVAAMEESLDLADEVRVVLPVREQRKGAGSDSFDCRYAKELVNGVADDEVGVAEELGIG